MAEASSGPLRPASVPALVARIHRALERHRDELDDLNVFPVPDGDTGSNLVLTLRAAVEAVEDADGEGEAAKAMMRGGLMGARGNSGVILSQVLRALGEAIDEGEGPLATYRDALAHARELAYDAVGNPVEGTMLTAIRVAAETVQSADADELEALSAQVVEAVADAVQASREQLEANREAGVVDAGARGFEVIVRALHGHLTGAPEDEGEPEDGAPPPVVARDRHGRAQRESGSEEFRFEVQYLLHADESVAPQLRERLGELGDSVVVVGAGDVLNVHVHTNRIDEAIEAGASLGRTERVDVTEFAEQIAAGADDAGDGRELATVAVLDGPGLTALARDLGARVVHGRAGDLPTVADVLEVVRRTSTPHVVVLPGHPNAVPTARQVVQVLEDDREVTVLESADSAVAVLAALAVCDPDADVHEAIEQMREAAEACTSGEVVAAVRDADTPVGQVRQGQWLAVVAGQVQAAHDEPLAALRDLARALASEEGELATLLIGAGVDDDERDGATAIVHDELGDGPELDVVDGGQSPQRYLLGVE